jgi:HPr kinase/phosphorylase
LYGYPLLKLIEAEVTWTHASAVNIETQGVLIRGPSRAGKSQVLMSLLRESKSKNLFACLIGDDRLNLFTHTGFLAASPHPRIAGLIENRGVGIIKMPYLAASRIHFVVDLGIKDEKLSCFDNATITLEGISLPLLRVKRGTPLAEITAKVFSLVRSS